MPPYYLVCEIESEFKISKNTDLISIIYTPLTLFYKINNLKRRTSYYIACK
jgi:hypothetical protein